MWLTGFVHAMAWGPVGHTVAHPLLHLATTQPYPRPRSDPGCVCVPALSSGWDPLAGCATHMRRAGVRADHGGQPGRGARRRRGGRRCGCRQRRRYDVWPHAPGAAADAGARPVSAGSPGLGGREGAREGGEEVWGVGGCCCWCTGGGGGVQTGPRPTGRQAGFGRNAYLNCAGRTVPAPALWREGVASAEALCGHAPFATAPPGDTPMPMPTTCLSASLRPNLPRHSAATAAPPPPFLAGTCARCGPSWWAVAPSARRIFGR